MSGPKRYDCEDIGGWEGGGHMIVRDNGDYVLWEDYDALEARHATEISDAETRGAMYALYGRARAPGTKGVSVEVTIGQLQAENDDLRRKMKGMVCGKCCVEIITCPDCQPKEAPPTPPASEPFHCENCGENDADLCDCSVNDGEGP